MAPPRKCLCIFSIQTLVFALARSDDTNSAPALDGTPNWAIIESEQTITTSSESPRQAASWHVREYVSLNQKLAYGVYTNTENNQSYELLSRATSKFYLKKRDDQYECELDHRHDYSTFFPWSYWFHSMKLTGVAGLWMNLNNQKGKCITSGSSLRCEAEQDHAEFSLDFHLTSRHPLRAEYLGKKVIWSDQTTVLDWVRRVVEVNKFEYLDSVPDEVSRTIELRKELCHSSDDYEPTHLPSLIDLLGRSEGREYRIKYDIVITDKNGQSPSWHKVEEWFSYGHGMQTFLREKFTGNRGHSASQSGSRDKLMQLFNVKDGSSLEYAIEYSGNSEKACRFTSLAEDDVLAGISPFMRRPIKLAPSEQTNSTKRNVGHLYGLGALLMYMAESDREGKVTTREEAQRFANCSPYDDDDEPEDNKDDDDYYGGPSWYPPPKVYLKYRKDGQQEITMRFKAKIHIRTLDQIDFTNYLPNGLLNTTAVIDSIDLQTDISSGFSEMLEHPFEVPSICPPVEDLIEPIPEQPTNEAAATQQSATGQLAAEDDFSFPSSESWHAYLKENYRIKSRWLVQQQADDAKRTEFEVIEYLMVDGSNELLGRIDVLEGEKVVKFLLDYGDDLQYRIEADHCEVVASVLDWLEAVSIEMRLAGYHQTDGDRPMRHFGLGGLWSLAARSESVDLVDLSKDVDGSNQFLATWMLHDDAELAENLQAKFSFLTRPDRELEQLSFDARAEASVLRRVEVRSAQPELLISISDLQIEPNAATRDDFNTPLACPPPLRAGKHRFPSILSELRRFDPNIEPDMEPSEVDFEVGYELLWATKRQTLLLQVTEMNLPQKQLRMGSLSIVSGQTLEQTNVSFWTRTGGQAETVLEHQVKSKPSVCSRAPELEHLMGLEAQLRAIRGIYPSDGAEFGGLPLSNFWNTFANDLERHPALYHVETKTFNGDNLHTIWKPSHDAQTGAIRVETKRDAKREERLVSVEIRDCPVGSSLEEAVSMQFQLTKIRRVPNLQQVLSDVQIPTGCKHLGEPSAASFPHLSRHMSAGGRLQMRSGVTRSDEVSAQFRSMHFLDEWLAFDEAYRSRYTTDGQSLGGQLITANQLIYPQTREYFDISEENHCKTVPRGISESKGTMLSANGSASSFIGECLFHSEHKVASYGPISLWLLAQEAKSVKLLFDGEPALGGIASRDLDHTLHFPDLFDESRFRDWLLTDRWLVEHETFGGFVMIFRARDGELYATQLDRIEQVTRKNPFYIQVINYSFETESSRFEQFDRHLRIPAGFGCVRSLQAREFFASRPQDQLVFDQSVPFVFHYEASLRLDGGSEQTGDLLARPVINTGRLMTCPERWTSMFTGALRVDLHETHHLSGQTSTSRRVVMRDFQGSSRATVRLIDELSGSCQIEVDRSNPFEEAKLIELDFSGVIVSLSMSQLLEYFQSTDGFEQIQDYDSDKEKIVVLEARRDLLKLNDWLAGPGSIVRTFTRNAQSREAEMQFFHRAAKLELLVHGKARLTLRVADMRFIECLEIIAEARPDECFRDRLASGLEGEQKRKRHFELVFEPVDFLPNQLDFNNLLASQVTIAEFHLNREYLEHDFRRVFFTQPDRIPVAQLGLSALKFDVHNSRLVAAFSLLEPTSLLHHFELLSGRAIDPEAAKAQVGIELVRRPASSKFKCADLCESRPHACLAFSYCGDRICTFVQTRQSKLGPESNQTQALSEGQLMADSNCSAYLKPPGESYAERHHVDEIVERIRSHIDGPKESNKFSLNMKFRHGKRKTRTRYVAIDLREQVQTADGKDGGQSGANPAELPDEFVILADRSDLDLIDLGAKMPALKTMMLEAQSLADCLAIQRLDGCRFASFCSVSRVCLLVANVTQWDQFESVASGVRTERDHCAVYSWDYTKPFELFDETREPVEFAWRETVASPFECAARCQLESDCLSFDLCPGQLDGKPALTCYGQKSHVSFNRLLLPTTADNKPVQAELGSTHCSHYSKLALADFEVVERKALADHNSILFREVSLEHCAAVCRKDTGCKSFEYCTKSGEWDGTCYIEKRLLASPATSNSTSVSASVGMFDRDDCSIYTLKSQILDVQAPHNEGALGDSGEPVRRLESHESVQINPVGWLCLIAATSGVLFGLVYRKLARNQNEALA